MRWLNIPRGRLEKVRGKILTAPEVLKTFGYSPKTNIGDTRLYKRGIIKPVGKNTWLVDEDLITMIEDLIERRRASNRNNKAN